MQIKQAAIKDASGNIHTLPRPARHYNIMHDMRVRGIDDRPNEVQGFITEDDEFVDRKFAAEIALEAGQCVELMASPRLYSEDLW